MAFNVMSSFLLRVIASKTIKQKHLIGCWKIPAIQRVVFEANTRSKKEDTTWKAMKNLARKCYIFLCTINFEVTWPFWKMWKSTKQSMSLQQSYNLKSTPLIITPNTTGRHWRWSPLWREGRSWGRCQDRRSQTFGRGLGRSPESGRRGCQGGQREGASRAGGGRQVHHPQRGQRSR